MSWGFEPGRVYNRRADIHARFGGQQQGGIVTPANHAAIIATTSTKNVYERSRDVRRYVLARSKGKCEGCSGPAPFSRPDGTPYLEPHHLKRLSDGGQITLHT